MNARAFHLIAAITLSFLGFSQAQVLDSLKETKPMPGIHQGRLDTQNISYKVFDHDYYPTNGNGFGLPLIPVSQHSFFGGNQISPDSILPLTDGEVLLYYRHPYSKEYFGYLAPISKGLFLAKKLATYRFEWQESEYRPCGLKIDDHYQVSGVLGLTDSLVKGAWGVVNDCGEVVVPFVHRWFDIIPHITKYGSSNEKYLSFIETVNHFADDKYRVAIVNCMGQTTFSAIGVGTKHKTLTIGKYHVLSVRDNDDGQINKHVFDNQGDLRHSFSYLKFNRKTERYLAETKENWLLLDKDFDELARYGKENGKPFVVDRDIVYQKSDDSTLLVMSLSKGDGEWVQGMGLSPLSRKHYLWYKKDSTCSIWPKMKKELRLPCTVQTWDTTLFGIDPYINDKGVFLMDSSLYPVIFRTYKRRMPIYDLLLPENLLIVDEKVLIDGRKALDTNGAATVAFTESLFTMGKLSKRSTYAKGKNGAFGRWTERVSYKSTPVLTKGSDEVISIVLNGKAAVVKFHKYRNPMVSVIWLPEINRFLIPDRHFVFTDHGDSVEIYWRKQGKKAYQIFINSKGEVVDASFSNPEEFIRMMHPKRLTLIFRLGKKTQLKNELGEFF